VPTGVASLASPQGVPTGVAILASPQGVPTGVATLTSPQSPPTNIQAEIEITDPPVFEPTNIEIALDNDEDGIFIPADEDDNNKLITEPLTDMSAEEFLNVLNDMDGDGEGFSYLSWGPFANTEKSTVTVNVNGSPIPYARQYATVSGSRFIIINDDGTVTGHARGTDSNGNNVFTHQTDLGVLSGDVIGSSLEIENRTLDGTSSFIQNITFVHHIETITASEWRDSIEPPSSLGFRTSLNVHTREDMLGSSETASNTLNVDGVNAVLNRRYRTSRQGVENYPDYVSLHVNDDLTCIGYIDVFDPTRSSGAWYFSKQADLGTITSSGFTSGISFHSISVSGSSITGLVF
jgi:hypothetical protein